VGTPHNCRLYWVQVKLSAATVSSAEQLLLFGHNTLLGTPTPNPKPYTTVLYSTDDTVRVQYQWQVARDSACCPTGIGTAQYQIGADGKLVARGPIPNQ
jgi:LppP/LprE lipoprotein